MQLRPDLRLPIMAGPNVPLPLGRREHYRATLYKEVGESRRSVLVISLNLRFHFRRGKLGAHLLEWSADEKVTFVSQARAIIEWVWENKFRITTTSTSPPAAFRDVGVVFDINMWIDGWHNDEDFSIYVWKTEGKPPLTSGVYHSIPRAKFTSADVEPAEDFIKEGQFVIAHEFGHLLGIDDEYFSDSHWVDERKSVMNAGNEIQPRYYVPFASWLTTYATWKWGSRSNPVVYKVDGRWDESNSFLKKPRWRWRK